MMRVRLLPLVAAMVVASGCSSDDPEAATTTTAPAGESPSGAAIAAVEFVSAAIAGAAAESHFASQGFDESTRGAPFDPTTLSGRLPELEALAGSVDSVSPSADPCDRAVLVRCPVDVLAPGGQLLVTVVVSWFDDGVTDFSIVKRSSDGSPSGVGQASCGPGFTLLHGGHTPDRFDIAVCMDPDGAVEYNGRIRNTELGIRLVACQLAERQWQATNEGFRYLVDGTPSDNRSTIQVFDPDGDRVELDPFTTVRFDPPATAVAC